MTEPKFEGAWPPFGYMCLTRNGRAGKLPIINGGGPSWIACMRSYLEHTHTHMVLLCNDSVGEKRIGYRQTGAKPEASCWFLIGLPWLGSSSTSSALCLSWGDERGKKLPN